MSHTDTRLNSILHRVDFYPIDNVNWQVRHDAHIVQLA